MHQQHSYPWPNHRADARPPSSERVELPKVVNLSRLYCMRWIRLHPRVSDVFVDFFFIPVYNPLHYGAVGARKGKEGIAELNPLIFLRR